MSIPANPLLSELVLEGLKQVGENNPSPDLVTRASTHWIEEIKNDIWHLAKKPKILQVTAYTIVNKGQSRYAYPSDYSSDLSLMLLYGSRSGVATGGSVSTVGLGTGLYGTEVIGREVLMLSGVSQGSFAQILAFDTTTGIASVVPSFATAPIASDTYMLVDAEYPITVKPIFDWDARSKFVASGLPQFAYPMGDDQTGYFQFDTPPNATYGCRLRYFADLSQVDANSTLMSVLYRKWRNIWVKGVRMKKAQDEDDDRSDAAEQMYQKKMQMLIYREIYGMDISNISDRVTDYS